MPRASAQRGWAVKRDRESPKSASERLPTPCGAPTNSAVTLNNGRPAGLFGREFSESGVNARIEFHEYATRRLPGLY